MMNSLAIPLRAVLLAAVLALAVQATGARAGAAEPQTTARVTARTKTDATADRDGVPIEGILIVAGIVGALILLAWVCSRVGDNRTAI